MFQKVFRLALSHQTLISKPSLFPHSLNPNSLQRFLHIHEYQGLELMKEYGIKVMEGGVASTPEEAETLARLLNTQDLVIKAQVHTGGRGKGVFDNGFKGGVHMCSTPEEARGYALKMIGHRLKTYQSGPEGKLCTKLFVGKRHFIRRELYFAIFLDRSSNGPVMVASPKGGVDIEAVANETPDLIFKEVIDINKGPTPGQIKNLVDKLHLKGSLAEQASLQINRLYQLFKDKDATLIEVNPLCETSYGDILCLDSKLNFDDSALFKHPEIEKLDDPTQYDSRELEARKADLNFIALDGDIGCLVNGAGLAMATMDMIKMCGGSPANFLDVGGGATDGQVSTALRVIASDVNVKAILVNIFGGIMKCDVIALGILNAVKILNLKIPIVLRLQGTNVKEAKALIEGSALRVIAADDLETAANKAVQVAKIVAMAKHAQLAVSFELPI